MRHILAVMLVSLLPSAASAADYFRPVSFIAYFAPDFVYYSEVYTENSCELIYFDRISIFLTPEDLRSDLPWPCPPTENLFGPYFFAQSKEKPKGEKSKEGTAKQAENAASASPRAFPGRLRKMEPNEEYSFELPPDARKGWEAGSPLGGAFVKFRYMDQWRYAKVFWIKHADNGVATKKFIAVEADIDNADSEITNVQECADACHGKHYVLSGEYLPPGKTKRIPIIILLAVDR